MVEDMAAAQRHHDSNEDFGDGLDHTGPLEAVRVDCQPTTDGLSSTVRAGLCAPEILGGIRRWSNGTGRTPSAPSGPIVGG